MCVSFLWEWSGPSIWINYGPLIYLNNDDKASKFGLKSINYKACKCTLVSVAIIAFDLLWISELLLVHTMASYHEHKCTVEQNKMFCYLLLGTDDWYFIIDSPLLCTCSAIRLSSNFISLVKNPYLNNTMHNTRFLILKIVFLWYHYVFSVKHMFQNEGCIILMHILLRRKLQTSIQFLVMQCHL